MPTKELEDIVQNIKDNLNCLERRIQKNDSLGITIFAKLIQKECQRIIERNKK
jgi:hypothetical protein